MINLGDNLYKKFPDLYLSEDSRQGYALQRFFQVLGGGFDELENNIIDFSNVNNVDLCPAPLLPLLAEMYGFSFPYDMDEATQRKFIKVIPFLYQYKGTDRAFKYLAREVFGEGTVTSTFSLEPPAGVSWDEWINDPKTKDDWQKLFVKLEVNGESLFLDDREIHFAKFTELIRPANKKVIPDLTLFYDDVRDKALTQELYFSDKFVLNEGEYLYRLRDGSDRITEVQQPDLVHLLPEYDQYDHSRLADGVSGLVLKHGKLSSIYYNLSEPEQIDYIHVNPENEINTALKYDEHVKDEPSIIDDEVRPNTLDDSSEKLFKSTDTSNDDATPIYTNDDSDNTEHSTVTDTDSRGQLSDDTVDTLATHINPEDEAFNSAGMAEPYMLDSFKVDDAGDIRTWDNTGDAPNNNFSLKFARLSSLSFGLGYRGQTEGVKDDYGMETMNNTYTETEQVALLHVNVETETYNAQGAGETFSTNINRTRTASTLKTLNKLVTGFRLTDFVPVTASLSY